MKTCTKCKIEKPFEAFYRNKSKYDGYHSSCIECDKLRKLELKKNPLMQLEKEIRTSIILENKLLQKESKRLCFDCKEIFLIDDLNGVVCKKCKTEKSKEYYEKNKEKLREYKREYARGHYEKNKERMKEHMSNYRLKNKEKIKKYKREYRENNKEKRNEYLREYRLKKKLEKENHI